MLEVGLSEYNGSNECSVSSKYAGLEKMLALARGVLKFPLPCVLRSHSFVSSNRKLDGIAPTITTLVCKALFWHG